MSLQSVFFRVLLTLLVLISCEEILCASNYTFKTDTVVKPYFDGKLFLDTQVVTTVWKAKASSPDDFMFQKGKYTIENNQKVLTVKDTVYSDSSIVEGLTKLLHKRKEIRLPLLQQQEFYRFLWIRSLDEFAIIKLYIKQKRFVIQVDWLQSGKIKYKKLTSYQLTQFRQLLKDSNFWTMKPAHAEMSSTDGSMWLIEAQNRNKYHFVYRSNPSKEQKKNIYSIGLWLIKTAGIQSERIY